MSGLQPRLRIEILPQPDEETCGPTCLQAVYRYYGKSMPLAQVIAEVPNLEEGGTLAVYLGSHALRQGFGAKLYTYNLQVFDPTWFHPGVDIRARLAAQMKAKKHAKLRAASLAYLEFLDLGGQILLQDLTPTLIRKYLNSQRPILAGLSATYLYNQAREFGPRSDHDDIRGEPSGHFVVLSSYNPDERTVLVADPYLPNPLAEGQYYELNIEHVINAILLGILTFDGNLLILEPADKKPSP